MRVYESQTHAIRYHTRIARNELSNIFKNVWLIRKYFLDTFGVEIPIINGDQMPLHRNESADKKTMTVKNQDTFVKENLTLSREWITVFTQALSDPSFAPLLEFVFKGKGHLNKLKEKFDPPRGVHAQWSPSGSYRLEHMLKTISMLPNRHNLFSHKNYAIYSLDNYSVHITPKVYSALLARGYIYVGIGGGITGDIQVNDTDILKANYHREEQELMIRKLIDDRSKIPVPSCNDIMNMLVDSWQDFWTLTFPHGKLDGSEDGLVSDSIYQLVGPELLAYRQQLLASGSLKSLKELPKRSERVQITKKR